MRFGALALGGAVLLLAGCMSEPVASGATVVADDGRAQEFRGARVATSSEYPEPHATSARDTETLAARVARAAALVAPLRTDDATSTPWPTVTTTPVAPTRVAALHSPDMPLPDGAALAWWDGEQVWVARDGWVGALGPATSVGQLWVAPDGARVVYRTDSADGWELWAADLGESGSSGRRPKVVLASDTLSDVAPVPPATRAEAHPYVWQLSLGSGDRAYFTLAERWNDLGLWQERDDTWLLDLDSGSARQLVPPGEGGPAVASPDGEWLAISRNRFPAAQIDLAAVDDSGGLSAQHELLRIEESFASESDWSVYPGVRWLPDSSAVLTARAARVDDDGLGYLDGPVDLLRVAVDGTKELVTHAGEGSVVWEQFPNGLWSVDGSRLAYLQIRPTSTPDAYPAVDGPGNTFASVLPERALYAASEPGFAPEQVDDVVSASVLWAPGGRALLYRPRRLMGHGGWSYDDWHLVREGGPPERRADLGYDVTAWLGDEAVLLAEPVSGTATAVPGVRAAVRLVAQTLDDRWREMAPRAQLWVLSGEEGVLR